jgi:hypothetical protein
MSRWNDWDEDEWREEIATAVGNGDDILDAAGSGFDDDVEHRLPKDPSTIGRQENNTESSDQKQEMAATERREASA